jgi:AbrB family looped-hinge helix DNA binding protein
MATVTIKPDGRVLIPARLRAELDVEPGEPLVARVDDGRLILERRRDAIRRLQKRFAMVTAASTSLVDELLEDRRAEVRRDG